MPSKQCKACHDIGFVYPQPKLRHFCGCLKGIQCLRESHDELLSALTAIRDKAIYAPQLMNDLALKSCAEIANHSIAKAEGGTA